MLKMKSARLFRLLLLAIGVVIVSLFITGNMTGILPATSPVAHASSGAASCTASSSQRPSFGSTITVETGNVLCGDVTIVGGTLSVQGLVRGNILAFGSNIVLDGGVSGDIRLFGGSIRFGTGSYVLGNVNLYGSRVDGEKEVRIDGAFDDHSKNTGLFGLGAFNLPIWFLLLMLPLGLFYARFFPEHGMFISATVKIRRAVA